MIAAIARDHREHRLQLQHRPYGFARLDDDHYAAAAAERNPPRKPSAPGRRHGASRRHRSWYAVKRSSARSGNAPAAQRARGVRRHLSGAAEVVRGTCACLVMALVLVFGVSAHRVPQLRRAHRDPHFVGAVDRRRGGGPAAYGHHLQRVQLHGLIMVIGIVAKNGILLLDADERYRAEGADARTAMLQRRAAPASAHPDDRAGRGDGHAAAGAALGQGPRCCSRWPSPSSADCSSPCCFSLVVTPVVYFLLTRREAPPILN